MTSQVYLNAHGNLEVSHAETSRYLSQRPDDQELVASAMEALIGLETQLQAIHRQVHSAHRYLDSLYGPDGWNNSNLEEFQPFIAPLILEILPRTLTLQDLDVEWRAIRDTDNGQELWSRNRPILHAVNGVPVDLDSPAKKLLGKFYNFLVTFC